MLNPINGVKIKSKASGFRIQYKVNNLKIQSKVNGELNEIKKCSIQLTVLRLNLINSLKFNSKLII